MDLLLHRSTTNPWISNILRKGLPCICLGTYISGYGLLLYNLYFAHMVQGKVIHISDLYKFYQMDTLNSPHTQVCSLEDNLCSRADKNTRSAHSLRGIGCWAHTEKDGMELEVHLPQLK
jgi:hypothetical protein